MPCVAGQPSPRNVHHFTPSPSGQPGREGSGLAGRGRQNPAGQRAVPRSCSNAFRRRFGGARRGAGGLPSRPDLPAVAAGIRSAKGSLYEGHQAHSRARRRLGRLQGRGATTGLLVAASRACLRVGEQWAGGWGAPALAREASRPMRPMRRAIQPLAPPPFPRPCIPPVQPLLAPPPPAPSRPLRPALFPPPRHQPPSQRRPPHHGRSSPVQQQQQPAAVQPGQVRAAQTVPPQKPLSHQSLPPASPPPAPHGTYMHLCPAAPPCSRATAPRRAAPARAPLAVRADAAIKPPQVGLRERSGGCVAPGALLE